MARLLIRIASVVAVGVIASACSSVPDWIDPTTWVSDKAPADDGKAPDLADIPGKPPTTTPDDRKQVADSLAADRAQASYSAEQLRAGADQPLAPPPPAAPPPSADSSASPDKDKAKASQDTDSANPPEPKKKGNAMFEAAQGHTEAAAVPSSPDQATPTSRTAPSPPPAPAQQVAAATPPPSSAQPDSLGFQTSSAPPPDPSVGQFVSPTLLNRYQRSASLNAGSPATATAEIPGATSTGTAPAGIVYFVGDGTKLTPVARAKVREIAQSFQSNGAGGFVRVVGHSSSRTPNMPVEQQQQLQLQRSQDRANAVARELIKDGVPAAKVLIEAAGDTQPKGEEGNRGAEIFLQS